MATTMLRDRIKKAADLVGGVDPLVELSGLKRRTLYDYISGKTEPKISAIVEISKHTGANVEWLATGEGVMCLAPPLETSVQISAHSAINAALFKQIGKLVTRVHKEENVKLPSEALIYEIAARYNDVMAEVKNPQDTDELKLIIQLMEHRMRKQLQTAANEPGSGKHSA
jgi:hypothetical protein